jgi:hypothetical protein
VVLPPCRFEPPRGTHKVTICRALRRLFICQYKLANKLERRPAVAHTLTCETCGKPFEAARSDALTCSTSCRVTRHRRERRAELLKLRELVAAQGTK